MKKLVFAVSFLLFARPIHAKERMRIDPAMLHFQYESDDGETEMACTHRLINPDSQDWNVVCASRRLPARKEFTVHLWVTRYPHPSVPKVSYEVLYWITDETVASAPVPASTTIWFETKQDAELHSLDVALGVDQDLASLRMRFDPGPS